MARTEADVSYLARVARVLRRAGARLHAVRDAAAALPGGFLQPDLPERQALSLREVQGSDVQAIQPGQDYHQLFSGHRLTAAGVSEAALHVRGYRMSATLQLLERVASKKSRGQNKGENTHGTDLSSASWFGVIE